MQSRDTAEIVGALTAFGKASNLTIPALRKDDPQEKAAVVLKAADPGRSIFISYARSDARWLTKLRAHLVPLERQGRVEIWHDGKIETVASWQDEIERALSTAMGAILLVSANLMAHASSTTMSCRRFSSPAVRDEFDFPGFLSGTAFSRATPFSRH